MAKLSDKAVMAIAVTVTAVLCIGGMYLLLTAGDSRQHVSVTVHGLGEEDAGPIFMNFETYAKAKIDATFVTSVPSFDDGTDVIMSTDGTITGEGIERIEIDILGTVVHVYFMEDPQGMTGFFIIWLQSFY